MSAGNCKVIQNPLQNGRINPQNTGALRQILCKLVPGCSGNGMECQENLLQEDIKGFFVPVQVTSTSRLIAHSIMATLQRSSQGLSSIHATLAAFPRRPLLAHPLKKRRDGVRRPDLDHHIEVADIDSQFQCAGADNAGTIL